MSRWLPTAIALGLLFAPELSAACAVCGSAVDDDGSRLAYIATTVALSALPLALFGAFVLWLRRQHRRRDTTKAALQPRPHPQ